MIQSDATTQQFKNNATKNKTVGDADQRRTQVENITEKESQSRVFKILISILIYDPNFLSLIKKYSVGGIMGNDKIFKTILI